MGKRVSIDTGGTTAFRKRQKVTHDIPTGEDASSGAELRRLLVFDQDLRHARHGLQSFKRLLDHIISAGENRRTKLAILQDYLESVRPRDTGEDAVFLGDVFEMWSFAVQVNDDGIMSSVAVVLALLLHVLSQSLELVRHGLGICKTLLQDRQLKSLSRNLSAEKSKGFIISPTLRLLREAVCLDGGAYARQIVRARVYTFTALSRNLEVGYTGDNQEDSRKTSVRTNAVRFLLSCIKYLHSDGKKELLSQKELLSPLTFLIKSDPPFLILEILDTLKTRVLEDSKIPREVKFKCFNTKTLKRFLSLYDYSYSTAEGADEGNISENAHQFLLHICTTPSAGILYPSTGLYPKESSEEYSVQSKKQTKERYDTAAQDDSNSDRAPVFNFVLSEFAARLRPWSSLKHNELLTAILAAAPELISEYFINNRSFTFEPKLSMTWIGYAAFLFNVIRIPLPSSFGDKTRYIVSPPSASILLDNILPLPLNQKVLVRCLSLKSNLISFFATRMLVESLEKLLEAVKMHEVGFRFSDARWTAAVRRLVDSFCQRIPDMKEIVRCYKAIPNENLIQKTMTSRLLRLYYEVIPQMALEANFDVSPFFVDILRNLQESSQTEPEAFSLLELQNLVLIASYSPGMRWFSRIEIAGKATQSSPFTALLRLLCSSDNDALLHQLTMILDDVAVENQLVSEKNRIKPLLQALRSCPSEFDDKQVEEVWSFLDNCINRCARSPIKYIDLLNSYLPDEYETTPNRNSSFNLLTIAVTEQLSFVMSSADSNPKKPIASFIQIYFNAMYSYKFNEVLERVYTKIRQQLSNNGVELKDPGAPHQLAVIEKSQVKSYNEEHKEDKPQSGNVHMDESKLEGILHIPFTEQQNSNVLSKWITKSVEDLIEDEWAAKLILLLTSEHTSIRKEALTSILKVAAKVEESSYEEKKQVWLLLSELTESSRVLVDVGPVPSAFCAFAIHAFNVLRNPLHPLYAKVNTFLTRSPVWSLEKIPLAHDILHGEPSEDDKYYTEISWFLGYILDALKTPNDIGVFHKKRWFEKILTIGCNPYLRSNLRLRILRIVYRATCIESGSTTLITRFGLMSWLDARRTQCAVHEDAELYSALMVRAWNTCDQARVMPWSRDGIERLLEILHRMR